MLLCPGDPWVFSLLEQRQEIDGLQARYLTTGLMFIFLGAKKMGFRPEITTRLLFAFPETGDRLDIYNQPPSETEITTEIGK